MEQLDFGFLRQRSKRVCSIIIAMCSQVTVERGRVGSLDPQGHFVYAAGSATGQLASYRINGATGELTTMETYPVGQRPMSVLTTQLGD